MTFKGWILAPLIDKEALESLGVKLGPYNHAVNEFTDCEVDKDVMDKLESHWGRWVWGLISDEELDAIDDLFDRSEWPPR